MLLELATEIAEPNNYSPSRTNDLTVQEEGESPSVSDAEGSTQKRGWTIYDQ